MKLSITQMVLGALAAVSSCFIIAGWLTTKFASPVLESNGSHVQLLVKADPVQVIAQISVFFVLILGLAVLGVGIAQLVKARRA